MKGTVKNFNKEKGYGFIKTDEGKDLFWKEEKEIQEIKDRNKRVELDKAWETSWVRKLCICILTYIVVVIYSHLINKINNVWLSSLVPVIGFTLSTFSLKLVRNAWEKNKKDGRK